MIFFKLLLLETCAFLSANKEPNAFSLTSCGLCSNELSLDINNFAIPLHELLLPSVAPLLFENAIAISKAFAIDSIVLNSLIEGIRKVDWTLKSLREKFHGKQPNNGNTVVISLCA